MNKKPTTEKFVEKVIKVHGDTYDYSLLEYTYAREKVIIICKNYGKFEQRASAHLSGHGCPTCGQKARNIAQSNDIHTFIEKANKVHNNFYDYSKAIYNGATNKIKIICSVHGDFEQRVSDHLSGNGCNKCGIMRQSEGARSSTTKFILKSFETHGDIYDYSKVEYIGSKNKVIIGCRQHGDFEQIPGRHIEGGGCPRCALNSKGFGRSHAIKKAKGKICTFYILRCFNENEEFYKIGITMRTIIERYNTPVKMPYNYQIISEVYGEGGSIWDLELSEKRKLINFHYLPKIEFAGAKKECFTQYKL